MGGELTIAELTGGVMRLRGPITKTDVVASRLQVPQKTFVEISFVQLSAFGFISRGLRTIWAAPGDFKISYGSVFQ